MYALIKDKAILHVVDTADGKEHEEVLYVICKKLETLVLTVSSMTLSKLLFAYFLTKNIININLSCTENPFLHAVYGRSR